MFLWLIYFPRYISWVENCVAILRAKTNNNHRKTGGFFNRTAHPAVQEHLTYYSAHKVRSLDVWLPFHQGKGNRALAAYEARAHRDAFGTRLCRGIFTRK